MVFIVLTLTNDSHLILFCSVPNIISGEMFLYLHGLCNHNHETDDSSYPYIEEHIHYSISLRNDIYIPLI